MGESWEDRACAWGAEVSRSRVPATTGGLAISIALASIPFAAFAIGLILNAASPRVRTQFMKNYE